MDWSWVGANPPLAWKIPAGRGYSSPVAAAGRVILFYRWDNDEILAAHELASGRELWRVSWPTQYRCRYEYSDGPYSTPLIHDQRVVAVGAEGRMVCVTLDDGVMLWERDLKRDFELESSDYAFGAGIAADQNRLYLNVGAGQRDAGVVCFDSATGETVWAATDHGRAFTSPRFLSGEARGLVVFLTDRGLVAVEREEGRVAWEYPLRSRVADTVNAVTPLVRDSQIFAVAGQGAGAVGLDCGEETPRPQWRDRRALDSVFNTLVGHRESVFGFTAMRQGGATLRKLDFATGKLLWERPSELDRGQAMAVDGRLVVVGEHGHLGVARLDDSTGESLVVTAAPLLERPCYSAPAVHHGRLLLRNELQLMAFDLRGKVVSPRTTDF
ncbi:MAG: PQQ-binding-like beta-propeller repeat protein [Pirellulales bacterium]